MGDHYGKHDFCVRCGFCIQSHLARSATHEDYVVVGVASLTTRMRSIRSAPLAIVDGLHAAWSACPL